LNPARQSELLARPVPLEEPLAKLQPLRWNLPLAGSRSRPFHSYLGNILFGLRVAGENLKYLVQARDGRDVACLLFGAAAWQTGVRDRFVGWTAAATGGRLSQWLIIPGS